MDFTEQLNELRAARKSEVSVKSPFKATEKEKHQENTDKHQWKNSLLFGVMVKQGKYVKQNSPLSTLQGNTNHASPPPCLFHWLK